MIHDLYSRRTNPPQHDVFAYDAISPKLRGQIIYVLRRLFHATQLSKACFTSADNIVKEFDGSVDTSTFSILIEENQQSFENYILKVKNYEQVLNAIEAAFIAYQEHRLHKKRDSHFEETVTALNERFLDNGVGYQYENGQIVRIDSQFVHAEVVKPALQLLSDPAYSGASVEFLKAHEHYRHGRYSECLVDCCKSFESTMKIICAKRGWNHQPNDAAQKLVMICLQNNLLPNFTEGHLMAVATFRNKLGGHGQGTVAADIPPHYASFVIHSTASTIILLVEAEKSLP